MIHEMFAVYDSKGEMHTLPFFVKMTAEAHRHFSTWVNDKTHTFGLHPEDYTLFHIGQYDDLMGAITQDKIVSIGNGLQFLKEEEK